MAGGGLWGNTLFFLVSGLGISLSSKFLTEPKLQWFRRRFSRIYPTTIIASLILYILIDGYATFPVRNYIRIFIWPTNFNYIGQIIIFYAIGFLIVRLHNNNKLPSIWIFALFVPIILLHIEAYSLVPDTEMMNGTNLRSIGHKLSNLQTFLIGIWLGLRGGIRGSLKKKAAFLLIIFVVYFSLKLITVISLSGSRAYSALIPLSQILAVATTLFLTKSELLQNVFKRSTLWRVITYIADHTLELYIVHFYFVHNLVTYKAPMFVKIVLIFLLSMIAAAILKIITNNIVKRIRYLQST